MLEILQEAEKAKRDKKKAAILALDMSAAYDLVDHKILIQQLSSKYSLSNHTVNWVQSFLGARKHCLDVEGKTSEALETGEQGVVQGGRSSGDQFLVYLNDLPTR